MNTSNSPVITLSTEPRTVETTENAASKAGARNWQSPSHRLFSTSTMEPNSKPRAFSLSTMLWQKAWILLTILFHMAVMALRNSSF